ncbi:VirB8/TrbF family protein [Sphingopyxis granuli]|uniref:Conjugal transfer protein TrbF n=1 Tax=Sphingopyxis granuli TaxID=267128 RepID=A0AA86GKK4_9SPHN|nr:VirB8/TrbF family protein [Sphingopyxis granuli]AMG73901.1 Conjugal transfer protein TrbF [Sphingopyxis granuli]
MSNEILTLVHFDIRSPTESDSWSPAFGSRLGEARAVSPATSEYRRTDPQIAWHLGRFIANVRSRSLDPVLMRENWLSAYNFATEHASPFRGEYVHAQRSHAGD